METLTGLNPKNLVMKIGLSGMVVFTLAFVLFSITRSDSDTQTDASPAASPQLPSDNRVQSGMNRIDATQRRIQAERAKAAADQLLQDQTDRQKTRRRPSASLQAPAQPLPGNSYPDDFALSEDELKLQETLRLEEIERRARSLRSAPLVKSQRQTASASPPVTDQASPTPTEDASPDTPNPREQYLENLKATLALFDNQGATDTQTQIIPPGTPGSLPAPDGIAPQLPQPKDYGSPTALSQAVDPPGWERVHEGSFLEAVLVTQLSGDFPGPILAQVAVPFYSRDRQQILIPRGARVVGTATAVSDRDQARLAIGFHRLIFPDGRWLVLDFRGLNQAGESGLKDQVNRHYLQLFAATGAVGILSGLTLRGSNPYAGGSQGFRAGAGSRVRIGRLTGFATFSQPAPDNHYPRGASAKDLVYFGCAAPQAGGSLIRRRKRS